MENELDELIEAADGDADDLAEELSDFFAEADDDEGEEMLVAIASRLIGEPEDEDSEVDVPVVSAADAAKMANITYLFCLNDHAKRLFSNSFFLKMSSYVLTWSASVPHRAAHLGKGDFAMTSKTRRARFRTTYPLTIGMMCALNAACGKPHFGWMSSKMSFF